jgi:hypothetical protein
MKTWEKIQKLDTEYVEARKRILLGTIDSVVVTMVERPKPQEPKIKNNATVKTTARNSQ